MPDRVLVPWEENLSAVPEGFDGAVFDGRGEPGDLSDVVFYVMPYGRDQRVDLLSRMPRMRVCQLLTAGYETAVPHLPDGVVLCNARGLHDASTAEHALALILADRRDLPRWSADQRAQTWNPHYTRSLAGSRVLIVGHGSIGRALESRLAPNECDIVKVARTARPGQGVHGIGDLHALLPEADVVVLLTPLSEETRGLVGEKELGLMRDGALVVNVARGPVLDTAALLKQEGRIRAALDVTDPEPLPQDHPLWTAPNVFVTPHVAGGSDTFYPRARRFIDEQLRRWGNGAPLENVVLDG
ncbi:2-hydroxyacid dehydrogenase [Nocardiopsis chromatogenes]|uniref:2-hydroxyacid dehydrogenase n=1 Tax=Nocardiopsis chromatogenes TaxID=280239 RepID=UPI000380753A|nr:2-hydroxyacid dehydrogenase [Nocardiopsis chromatogenes]